MAAAMARPCPVFPDVGSTIVPPGFSRPARSAASIMGSPMRSLTLPPGFSISNLARMVGFRPRVTLCRRTSGVLPTASRKLSITGIRRPPATTAPALLSTMRPHGGAAPGGSAAPGLGVLRGDLAVVESGRRGDVLRRHGPPEVEALAEAAPIVLQEVPLLLGLDA